MSDYQLRPGGVTHIPTGRDIPASTTNRSWREYLAWVAKGNTPDPMPPPPPPPTVDEMLEDLMSADEQTRRVLKAVIILLAQRFAIPLDTIKQSIKDNM